MLFRSRSSRSVGYAVSLSALGTSASLGGGGGSVWLTLKGSVGDTNNNYDGNGIVSALGGDGCYSRGGAGAGGRIAIIGGLWKNKQHIHAYGGRQVNAVTEVSTSPAPGTIYSAKNATKLLSVSCKADGRNSIQGSAEIGYSSPGGVSSPLTNIVVNGSCALRITGNNCSVYTSNISGDGDGSLFVTDKSMLLFSKSTSPIVLSTSITDRSLRLLSVGDINMESISDTKESLSSTIIFSGRSISVRSKAVLSVRARGHIHGFGAMDVRKGSSLHFSNAGTGYYRNDSLSPSQSQRPPDW